MVDLFHGGMSVTWPVGLGEADPRPYVRLAARLRREISTGALAPGHPAPSITALCEAGPLGDLERAQVDMIRAQIAYSQNRGSDAPALLLRAARRLEPFDLSMARATYLDAVLAGHFAGRLARGSLREAAEAARRVPPTAEPATPSGLLLDGLATAVTDEYAAGVPALKQDAVHDSSNSGTPSSKEPIRAK